MTNILGTNSNEQLFGTFLADVIAGLFGDDTIYSRQGDDTLKGNDGNDQLFGEDGNDLLEGGNGNDRLHGQNGHDRLYGDGGNGRDKIYGGNDIFEGNAGDDIFFYNTNAAFNINAIGTDTIRDFGDGNDRIHLDKTTFKALSSNAGFGFSRSNEFAVVSQDSLVARSAAKIVFSKGTGNLFYNENGSAAGMGSGGHFVTLNDVDNLGGWQFKIHN